MRSSGLAQLSDNQAGVSINEAMAGNRHSE
jgi:hypothetical protein